MKAKIVLGAVALLALAWIALVPATPADEATAADAGKAVYEKKCAMCHGKDGVAKAMAKGSANFNDAEWQKSTTAEQIVKITTAGKDKMPKYEGKLTAEEIQAVAEYVLTIK